MSKAPPLTVPPTKQKKSSLDKKVAWPSVVTRLKWCTCLLFVGLKKKTVITTNQWVSHFASLRRDLQSLFVGRDTAYDVWLVCFQMPIKARATSSGWDLGAFPGMPYLLLSLLFSNTSVCHQARLSSHLIQIASSVMSLRTPHRW